MAYFGRTPVVGLLPPRDPLVQPRLVREAALQALPGERHGGRVPVRSSGDCLLCWPQPRTRGPLFRGWSPKSLWSFSTFTTTGCSSPLPPCHRARSDTLSTDRLLRHGRDPWQALLPGPSGQDTVLILNEGHSRQDKNHFLRLISYFYSSLGLQ